jgi:hypothetical protein
MALAMTAPVAPAIARPHGGIGASFDCPAMASGVQKLNICLYQEECSRHEMHDKPCVYSSDDGGCEAAGRGCREKIGDNTKQSVLQSWE